MTALAGTLDVEVTYAAHRPWAPRRMQFKRWALVAVAGLSCPAVLSVCVVGTARSRHLNARYRRGDKPTNVLSFSGAGVSPEGMSYLGELVICAPVVAREAKTLGRSAESHWAHLTVHGVLHLLGFDHAKLAEARKMAAMETQILDQLGFSDPYA